jgi:hypothetical protein
LGDLSHNELQAAIRLLSRITERNGCDVASDRATALADEIEPLVDAIVAAEASTLAGLRTKALAALWEARPSSTYGGIEFPDDGYGVQILEFPVEIDQGTIAKAINNWIAELNVILEKLRTGVTLSSLSDEELRTLASRLGLDDKRSISDIVFRHYLGERTYARGGLIKR